MVSAHACRIIGTPMLIPLALAARGQAQPRQEGHTRVLTKVAEVRSLTATQASQQYPIHLKGVITYHSPEYLVTFFQDRTAGIFLFQSADSGIAVGDLVQVDGNTTPGEFAPSIEHTKIQVVGHASLPSPAPKSIEDLMTGQEDSQWVQVEGIVHSVAIEDRLPPDMRRGPPQLVINFASGSHKFKARVRDFRPDVDYSRLVDAVVTVRGACGTLFNERRQLVGVQLFVPSLQQVAVDQAAPDAYTLPPVSIGSVMQFSPAKSADRRTRIQGVVTLSNSGHWAYVQDASGGVIVETAQAAVVEPGDLVDAVGFPSSGRYAPILQDGTFRKIGKSRLPVPVSLSAAAGFTGHHDAELVRIDGRLLDQSERGEYRLFTMQLGNFTFTGRLDRRVVTDRMRRIRNGSRLQMRGVWSVETDEYQHPTSFQVLLHSADDIVILRQPSWWTGPRVVLLLALLVAVILLALGWVFLLRRRVRTQIAVIRQRIEREAALERRFQNLLQNANDVIVTADPQGLVRSLNRAGEQIWGYTQAEVLGTPLSALVATDQEELAEAVRRVSRGEVYPIREWDIAGRNGRRTLVEVSLQTIRDGAQPSGILGIARDITDRKRAEREILSARKMAVARDAAEEANRAKSAFLANMSHELRTPLNAIIGYSEMLREDAEEHHQAHSIADLERITAAGRHLLTLINEVLDLSKIEAGRTELVWEDVPPAQILEDVAGAMAPLAKQNANQLIVHCAPNLPAMHVDVVKFRQSLYNLVSNACKFTKNGTIAVDVVPVTVDGTEYVEWRITDTGIGIASGQMHKLFRPFSQVDASTTRKYGGTGLGLAISQRFCELMGGAIMVVSEPGKGSTFTIRLPHHPDHSPAAQVPPLGLAAMVSGPRAA